MFFSSLVAQKSSNEQHLSQLQKTLKDSERYTNRYTKLDVYDLDVVEYYNLSSQYSTPLKIKVFKKTDEYQEKLDDLKKIKKDLMAKKYYVTITKPFKEYDLKKGGFKTIIKENMGQGTSKARPPKEIGGVYFGKLPFQYTVKKDVFGERIIHKDIKEEYMFFKVKESDAVKIEENYSDIKIYFIFNICSKKEVNYKYNCYRNGWYKMKEEILQAKATNVLIANEKTGQIYYSKKY